MGFDYTYRGNQNELLAEALGMMHPFEKLAETGVKKLLSYEPVVHFALDDDCKTQCRLSIETRTTAYQIRTGEFNEEPLSVFLTVRRFDSLSSDEEFGQELQRLAEICETLVDSYLVEHVLQPLHQTIALK